MSHTNTLDDGLPLSPFPDLAESLRKGPQAFEFKKKLPI